MKYTESDVALMARMMRAEAEGEGQLGMLMVGNVIVNRLKADCLDFLNLDFRANQYIFNFCLYIHPNQLAWQI